MSFEHPGNVFDRSQPTPDRPAVPAIKEALGLSGVKTAPEFSEKFLQLPGSGDLASPGTQGDKLHLVGLVPVVEILWPDVLATAEQIVSFGMQLAVLGPPHPIDRLAQDFWRHETCHARSL